MHPFAIRTWTREKLPSVLVNFEFAAKAKNCTSKNAGHCWYNKERTLSARYHCEVIEESERMISENQDN